MSFIYRQEWNKTRYESFETIDNTQVHTDKKKRKMKKDKLHMQIPENTNIHSRKCLKEGGIVLSIMHLLNIIRNYINTHWRLYLGSDRERDRKRYERNKGRNNSNTKKKPSQWKRKKFGLQRIGCSGNRWLRMNWIKKGK